MIKEKFNREERIAIIETGRATILAAPQDKVYVIFQGGKIKRRAAPGDFGGRISKFIKLIPKEEYGNYIKTEIEKSQV